MAKGRRLESQSPAASVGSGEEFLSLDRRRMLMSMVDNYEHSSSDEVEETAIIQAAEGYGDDESSVWESDLEEEEIELKSDDEYGVDLKVLGASYHGFQGEKSMFFDDLYGSGGVSIDTSFKRGPQQQSLETISDDEGMSEEESDYHSQSSDSRNLHDDATGESDSWDSEEVSEELAGSSDMERSLDSLSEEVDDDDDDDESVPLESRGLVALHDSRGDILGEASSDESEVHRKKSPRQFWNLSHVESDDDSTHDGHSFDGSSDEDSFHDDDSSHEGSSSDDEPIQLIKSNAEDVSEDHSKRKKRLVKGGKIVLVSPKSKKKMEAERYINSLTRSGARDKKNDPNDQAPSPKKSKGVQSPPLKRIDKKMSPPKANKSDGGSGSPKSKSTKKKGKPTGKENARVTSQPDAPEPQGTVAKNGKKKKVSKSEASKSKQPSPKRKPNQKKTVASKNTNNKKKKAQKNQAKKTTAANKATTQDDDRIQGGSKDLHEDQQSPANLTALDALLPGKESEETNQKSSKSKKGKKGKSKAKKEGEEKQKPQSTASESSAEEASPQSPSHEVLPTSQDSSKEKKGFSRFFPWSKSNSQKREAASGSKMRPNERSKSVSPPEAEKNTTSSPKFDEHEFLKKKLAYEETNNNESIERVRENRQAAYLQDKRRRASLKIQSLYRGHLVRKKKLLPRKKPDPTGSTLSEKEAAPQQIRRSQSAVPKPTTTTILDLNEAPRRPVRRSQSAAPNQSAKKFGPNAMSRTQSAASSQRRSTRWSPWSGTKTASSASLASSSRSFLSRKMSSQPVSKDAAFDRSLYIQRRMYQDEYQSETKSLAEIRADRRLMYLRDLEIREATRIQSLARGYLTRKRLSKSRTFVSTRTKTAMSNETPVATTNAPRTLTTKKSEGSLQVDFDRASYLRERLEREEAELQMLPMEVVRQERRRVYLLDLERREATRIQAVARGFITRMKYSLPSRIKRKLKEQQASEIKKKAPTFSQNMKRFFFGAPRSTNVTASPSDEHGEIQTSLLEESAKRDSQFRGSVEVIDADFFGFDDKINMARTGYFEAERSRQAGFISQGYTAAGRNWKGRQTSVPSEDFDKTKYWREWRERDMLEEETKTSLQQEQSRLAVARIDLERRQSITIQAALRGYLVRKALGIEKPRDRSILIEYDDSTEVYEEEILEVEDDALVPNEEVSKNSFGRKPERDRVSNMFTLESHAPEDFTKIKLKRVDRAKNENRQESKSISVVPKLMNINESNSDIAIKGISSKVDAVLLDYRSKKPAHSGLTHSADVGGASWWLPSLTSEDNRPYRQEILIPEADNKFLRRPEKNSTTTYWEAVRGKYLLDPAATGSSNNDGDVSFVPSVSNILRKGPRSGKFAHDTSLPPVLDDLEMSVSQSEEDSWVPRGSKPAPRAQRIDFTGTVHKESFRWAPHLPERSQEATSRSISFGDDQGRPGRRPRGVDKMDVEQGRMKQRSQRIPEGQRSNRSTRVLLYYAGFLVTLGGGVAAAYFFWDDPPWQDLLD